MNYFDDPNLCLICFGYHPLKYCKYFKTFTIQQRIYLVRVHRYCPQCFSRSHLLDECTLIDSCDKCSRPHHTMLHRKAHPSAYSSRPGPYCQTVSSRESRMDSRYQQREYRARDAATLLAQYGAQRSCSGQRLPNTSHSSISLQRERDEQQPTSTSMEPPCGRVERGRRNAPKIFFPDVSCQMQRHPTLTSAERRCDRRYNEGPDHFIPISTSSQCGPAGHTATPSSNRSYYDQSYLSSITSRWLHNVQQQTVPPPGEHLYERCCNDYSCPHMGGHQSSSSSRHRPSESFYPDQRRHSMSCSATNTRRKQSRHRLASHPEPVHVPSTPPLLRPSWSPGQSSGDMGSRGLSFSTRRSREPSSESEWSGDVQGDSLNPHLASRTRSPFKKRESTDQTSDYQSGFSQVRASNKGPQAQSRKQSDDVQGDSLNPHLASRTRSPFKKRESTDKTSDYQSGFSQFRASNIRKQSDETSFLIPLAAQPQSSSRQHPTYHTFEDQEEMAFSTAAKQPLPRKRFVEQSCTQRSEISLEPSITHPSSPLTQADEDRSSLVQRDHSFSLPNIQSISKDTCVAQIQEGQRAVGDPQAASHERHLKRIGDEDQSAPSLVHSARSSQCATCDRVPEGTHDDQRIRSGTPTTLRSEPFLNKREPQLSCNISSKVSAIRSKNRSRLSTVDFPSRPQCSKHFAEQPPKQISDRPTRSPPSSTTRRLTRSSLDSRTSILSLPIKRSASHDRATPSSPLTQADENRSSLVQRDPSFSLTNIQSISKDTCVAQIQEGQRAAGDLETASHERHLERIGDEDQSAPSLVPSSRSSQCATCDRVPERTHDEQRIRSGTPTTLRSEPFLNKREPQLTCNKSSKVSAIRSKNRSRLSTLDPASRPQCSKHFAEQPPEQISDRPTRSPPSSSTRRLTRSSLDSRTSILYLPITRSASHDRATPSVRNKQTDKLCSTATSRSKKRQPSIDAKICSVIRHSKRSRISAPGLQGIQSQSSEHLRERLSEQIADQQGDFSSPLLTIRPPSPSCTRRRRLSSVDPGTLTSSHPITSSGSSSQAPDATQSQPQPHTSSQQSENPHRTHQEQLLEIQPYLQQLLQHLKGPKEYWHTPANRRRQQLMRQQLFQLKGMLRQLIQDVASRQPRCRSPTCTCQQQANIKTLFQQLLHPLQQCHALSSSRQLHSCIQQLIKYLQQQQCGETPPVRSRTKRGFQEFLQQLRKLEQECQTSERGHRVEILQQRLRLQVILRQLLKAALDQLTEILHVVTV